MAALMNATITHQRLADLVKGHLVQGDPDGIVTGLNSVSEAAPGEVTFLGNARYLNALKTTRATAALVPLNFREPLDHLALILVENPTAAFSQVIRFFRPAPKPTAPGVDPAANVADTARFNAETVSIGANAVIQDDVVIGDGTVIHPGVFIGHGVRIGNDCVLHANVAIREHCVLGNRVAIHSCAVIGTDGFGYELKDGRYEKIEQVGIVQIDDDVEIGSCTTIDRARFGRTWIGAGTKIDNLVQIGHNVVVGRHCIIVSQVGIAGSTRLGDNVTLAGQVGIAGHLEIGSQITVLAQSGVSKSLTKPGAYTGYPAKPLMEGRRLLTLPGRIPELLERIKVLEEKLQSLEIKSA